jgi:DNA-binding response OmpR family regulator
VPVTPTVVALGPREWAGGADLATIVGGVGATLVPAGTVAEVRAAAEGRPPEVLVVHTGTPHLDELPATLAEPALERTAVLAVLPAVDVETAVQAAELGAHDFLALADLTARGPTYLAAACVPVAAAPPARRRRVLLADSQPGRTHRLTFLLLRAGFDVVRAADVPEAIATLEEAEGEEAIDLVIVDFDLPRGDPASLLAQATERMTVPAPTGIAMLTPGTPPETAAAALANGYRHLYHARRPADELIFLANEATVRDHGQQRAAPRFPCAALVRFRQPGGPWYAGLSYNVSISGLFVRTIVPPEAHEVLDVEVMPPGTGTIAARARVAWRRAFAARADRTAPTGMGLKLCEPDLAVQRAMAVFVLQLAGP